MIPGPLVSTFPLKSAPPTPSHLPLWGSSIQLELLLPLLSAALTYDQNSPSRSRRALLSRFICLQILKIPVLLFQGPALRGPCNNWLSAVL